MKLTRYTDYALRVMMFLAARGDDLVSIRQIADGYGISQNHLMKIVQDLGQAGFVTTVRGRHGGLRLARPAAQISIGAIVRHTEDHDAMVDCDSCRIAGACALPQAFAEASEAFMRVLDGYDLAQMLARPAAVFGMMLGRQPPASVADPG